MELSPKDFRNPAVAASTAALQALGPQALENPNSSGTSYCITSPHDASSLLRIFKLCALFALLGIGALVTGIVLHLLLTENVIPSTPFRYTLAIACWGGGIFLCLAPAWAENFLSRKYLKKHFGDFWTDKSNLPTFVAIENAHTYHLPKVLSEDCGIVIIHPDLHCVEIEALKCRYLIHAEDLLDISLHTKGKTVLLSYNASGVRLDLAIIPRAFTSEIKRQTLGSDGSLFNRIKQTLSPSTELEIHLTASDEAT